MLVPSPRGELSAELFAALRADRPAPDRVAPSDAEDLQITLWVLYELHHRGFEDVDAAREWDPDLLAVRAELEDEFEAGLRERTHALAEARGPDVVAELERITAHETASLAGHLHRRATAEQFREFLALRSIYHLAETDAHSWLLPRLEGAAKTALAELVYDEFGAGRPEMLHQRLYAEAMVAAGLDPGYGHYIDDAPAHLLAVTNAMALFGLHRRLRAAGAGHLAAFEMTSSLPCRRIVQGARRLGLADPVVRYFDEHVEADAVHEHVASRSLCGALVAEDPDLLADVLFGAAACVLLDGDSAEQVVSAWEADRSALRGRPIDPAA